MGKNIVVDGCTLSLSSGIGTITITSLPESNAKINGNGIYAGSLSFSVNGFTGTSITVPGTGSGTGTINGTGIVKINDKKVLLENDSVDITLNGFKPQGNTTVSTTENVTVTITSAGQTSIKSN